MARTKIEIAHDVYSAFERRDAKTLAALMDPDFVGEVAAGLPNEWGGTYRGPQEMLSRCWGRVLAELDTRPVAEEKIPTEDGRLLVLGYYRGSARGTGREHEAAFAHLLTFRDGLVTRVWQLTDSQRWHEALLA